MSALQMNMVQMNSFTSYTLNDYVTLVMTIINYMFVHDKMTYWMDSMNEKTMNTFIQVNFMLGITLFTYSYVCFFYNDFVRGVYTTMWAFLMFYNILMAQIRLMNKVHLNTIAYASTDHSDTSDDEMEEDEEGDAFEEEVLKNHDEKIVENIVNRIMEMADMASQREVAEILVNEFKNVKNNSSDAVPEVAEVPQEVVYEATPESAAEHTHLEENSVSDSPINEGTPIETERQQQQQEEQTA
jgi:hypothetical protein